MSANPHPPDPLNLADNRSWVRSRRARQSGPILLVAISRWLDARGVERVYGPDLMREISTHFGVIATSILAAGRRESRIQRGRRSCPALRRSASNRIAEMVVQIMRPHRTLRLF